MYRPVRPGPAPRRRATGILLPLLASFVATGMTAVRASPEPTIPPAPQAATSTPGPLPRRTAAPTLGAGEDAATDQGGFEATLRSHLLREGRRQRIDQPLLPATPFLFGDAIDDMTAADGSRRAGRTILRSLRGALDDHLETAARESGSLTGLFRFLDARGATPPVPSAASGDAIGAVPAAPAAGAEFGFRFRLDAHPRLVLGGRIGRLEGRLEVPVLDREIRMTVEHPIGGLGGAALRGGHSEDRGSWADLSLALRF
jgi:hypothetical protein